MQIRFYYLISILFLVSFYYNQHVVVAQQGKSWQQILEDSKGQTVYFNAWGGSPTINTYISGVAERAKELYDINLVQVKVTDISLSIVRVLAEKSAGNYDQGNIDLVWINGENFLTMLENDLLYGPFVDKLPNSKYINQQDPAIKYDFSVATRGYESPWGSSRLVFIYDTQQVNNPPKTASQFLSYAKQNPNRLTYPQPPDFTGTTFLKQMLYNLVDQPQVLLQPATDANYDRVTAPLWEWLTEITPFLWKKGAAYPQNATHQRELLNQKVIDVTYSFAPGSAASDVLNNDLPASVRTYVPESGTIGNSHFVAIPFNSTVKDSASLVIANMLLSPQEQLLKYDPINWGDLPVLDLDKLDDAWRQKFSQVKIGEQTLQGSQLGQTLPEPHPSWIHKIEADWQLKFGQ